MIHDTWADSDAPLVLELYYSGAWQDITAYLSDGGWTVTRGRRSGTGTADPSEFSCTLDNTGGRFSPRNPASALYGLIGRNTPLRASIVLDAVTYVRFVGEVSEWPQRWTIRGSSYAPITASGITRRHSQGGASLASTYRRAVTAPVSALTALQAYWPFEEGPESTSAASGLPTGQPLAFQGTYEAGEGGAFLCSSPLLKAGAGFKAAGPVPAYTSTGEWQAAIFVQLPDGGLAASTRVLQVVTTNLTCGRWHLSVSTTGAVDLTVVNGATGATLFTTGWLAFALAGGTPYRLKVGAWADGGQTSYLISAVAAGAFSGVWWGSDYTTVRIAAGSPGAATWVSVSPDGTATGSYLGHVTLQREVTSVFEGSDALAAYAYDAADDRIDRLAGNLGHTAVIGAGTGSTLGPERVPDALELMREAEATDLGWLYEPRDTSTFAYRTRESSCAQAPACTITYTDNLLKLEPVEDDSLTRNRVTVTREDGGSAMAEDTSSSMGTAAPPTGVGVYEESVQVSSPTDSVLPNRASWRLHEGTIDQARWPTIGVELAHPTFVADPALTADVLGLDIGDRLVVTGLPSWLPPLDVDQLVHGYTERVTPQRYSITFVCTPYAPRRVPVYDDITADDVRYSGAGTVLAAAATDVATSFTVTAPAGVSWGHGDGDYDVLVGGEVATVTGVAGAWPTYTLTVTRSVNGVVKAQASGTPLDVHPVAYWAL